MNRFALPYRGTIQGIVSSGAHAAFITTHDEKQSTGLYRLNANNKTLKITNVSLSSGATAIVANDKNLWLAGEDHKLYSTGIIKGKLRALPNLKFEGGRVFNLALLQENRLAVLQPHQLTVIDLDENTVLQTIPCKGSARVLATSPDGLWLAIGDSKGGISVYQTADKDPKALILSGESTIHDGAVTTLHFEVNELRFYSTGTDKKLFSTHAQGQLEPLDRGKSNNHQSNIHAFCLGKSRFYTGGKDKSIKSWPIAGGQPVSLKEGLAKISAIASIRHEDRDCLIVVGRDASLRIVGLTEDEKFTEVTDELKDGYAWAKHYLQKNKPAEREDGIAFLAGYDDKKALAILAMHFNSEKDKAVCEKLVAVFIKSSHAESTPILESFLKDNRYDGLRQQVFKGLLKRADKNDLRPYEKALESGHEDISRDALTELAKVAKTKPLAAKTITQALSHDKSEVRHLALSLLEKIYEKTSPRASLLALKTDDPRLQRAALIRLYQRKLLDHIDVKRAILLAQDNEDDQLRHTALLVSILSRPELSKALKTREENFARQLKELEEFELLSKDDSPKQDKKKHSKSDAKTLPKPSSLKKLGSADYAILLQSMTSMHDNVCFNSAFALAVLQDQRAYGVLLSLAQNDKRTMHIGVCHAFALLGQKDAIPALEIMLNSKMPEIRESAFGALETLYDSALITAEQGLQSKHQDIHARGLKLLLDSVETKLTKENQAIALGLLKAALNDPFDAIRQETFKACLNKNLGGSEESTLELLLESEFENVHQEVLSELMAKNTVKPIIEWVEPLLFKLFDNAFENIRSTAFNFTLKEKKRFDNISVLSAATASQFIDIRQRVLNHVAEKPTKKNQQFLQRLLSDEDKELRTLAMKVLISRQNIEPIVEALDSLNDDTKILAAVTLAGFRDERSFAIFDTFLSAEEPQKKQDKEQWLENVSLSLAGMGALGDVRGYDHVQLYLKSKKQKLVLMAAKALPWVTDTSHEEELLLLQKDEREPVRILASYALALQGNKAANKHLYPGAKTGDLLQDFEQVAIILSLGDVSPKTLERHLSWGKNVSTLLSLISHELLLSPDEPKLSAWALGLDNTDLQRFCAGLMTCYSDEAARWVYVQQWLIDSHSSDKWTIDIDHIKEVAAVLVYSNGVTKAKMLSVLQILEMDQSAEHWQTSYQHFRDIYADEIKSALSQVKPSDTVKPLQKQWNQQAFGLYLAQVRKLGGDYDEDEIGDALKSLHRLYQLAKQDNELHSSVESCLLMLLNHNNHAIHDFAFQHLQKLGMDLSELGKVATTSPQQAIARQGLELLTTHYSAKKASGLLQDLMQGDDEILTVEAYKLYRDDIGLVDAAEFALQSYHFDLRQTCVHELAAADNKKTQAVLVKVGASNDHSWTAISAATHLAKQRHAKAFDLLSGLLEVSNDEQEQRKILRGLKLLDNAKVAEFLFDYVQYNPLNRLPHASLYEVIATYRHAPLFDDLLACLEARPKEDTQWIMQNLVQITGYDQPFEDFFEKNTDRSWLDKQYPRQDDLLLRFFFAMVKMDFQPMVVGLIPVMGWPQSKETDQVLQDATPVLDVEHLPTMIDTLKHRLKYRNGSAEALLSLLTHKDNDVQLLAAEALALNGHNQGFAILLAAVDYQEDDDYRERAVLALGRSGDERALDKLLLLAEDKEHMLNEAAIEAIGSMSKSEKADKIFKLLKSSLQNADYYSDMNESALSGLRWFNSLEAWQLICIYIENTEHSYDNREHATKLLKHWDTDASRGLLLKLLKSEADDDVCKAAYIVAQQLWQTPEEQSNEVDYAALQGHYPFMDEKVLKRITAYSSTSKLLELLTADYANDPDDDETIKILKALDQSLIQRTDYTASDLSQALESTSPQVINTISRLITRMDKITKPVEDSLQDALSRYYQRWQKIYIHSSSGSKIREVQQAVLQLLWAVVKQGVTSETVQELLPSSRKEHQPYVKQILNALLSLDKLPNTSLLKDIEGLLTAASPETRHLANQLMELHGQSKGVDWRHFQNHASIIMDEKFSQPLVEAAGQLGEQSLALPALIAKQDTNTLMKVANDDQQQEAVRLGAIEGLARILTDDANSALSNIQQHSSDKDISKAAYRALRRLQRSLQQAEHNASLDSTAAGA